MESMRSNDSITELINPLKRKEKKLTAKICKLLIVSNKLRNKSLRIKIKRKVTTKEIKFFKLNLLFNILKNLNQAKSTLYR